MITKKRNQNIDRAFNKDADRFTPSSDVSLAKIAKELEALRVLLEGDSGKSTFAWLQENLPRQ